MPTYDYSCESCDFMFELRLKFSDDVDQPCKECGSVAKRQFSAVPIVFKGSGWYVNDYGKKKSSSGKPGDSSSSESDTKSSNEKKPSDTTSTKESKSSDTTSKETTSSSSSSTSSNVKD